MFWGRKTVVTIEYVAYVTNVKQVIFGYVGLGSRRKGAVVFDAARAAFLGAAVFISVLLVASFFSPTQGRAVEPAPAGAPAQQGSLPNDALGSIEPIHDVDLGGAGQQSPLPAPVDPDPTFNPQPPFVPGELREGFVDVGNGNLRRYLIHVGTNYRPHAPELTPVVFGFGGWKDTPEKFAEYSRFELTDFGANAIIIYPEGIARAWEGAPYASTRMGDDVHFVRTILNAVDADYRIDRGRVYAVGMSNGGGMAASLACHAPDLVAGVVSVSAAYYEPVVADCAPGAVATLDIHGTHDEVIAYQGGMRHGAPFLGAEQVVAGVAARNGCGPALQPRWIEGPAEHYGFAGCAAPVEHIRVLGQKHVWNGVPHATTLAWEFLHRQHK